jgi:hypothetical protein
VNAPKSIFQKFDPIQGRELSMEFEGDKVARETQYFGDPFEASAWRSPWVEPMEREQSVR